MRSLLLSAVSLLGLGYVGAALAGDTGPIRIGVITDLSGQNSDVNGVGAVEAVKMAVEDFKGQVGGRPVEVLFADHQNKPDVAALIARKWIEEGVDMLADISGSAPALAVNKLATDSNRVAMSTAAVSTEITGKSCSPNVVQFVMDTYAMAAAVTVPMSSRFGKEWYFITLNFGFGIDACDLCLNSGTKKN